MLCHVIFHVVHDLVLGFITHGDLQSSLILFAFFSHSVFLIVGVLAGFDYDLWGALHIDTDGILKLWVLDRNNGSLQLGVEWNLSNNVAWFGGHHLMDRDLSLLEPLEERDFSTVAYWEIERVLGHLDVGLRVVDNALNDLCMDNFVKVTVVEGVNTCVLDEEVLSVEVDDLHFFCGHGASLAQAQISDETNSLNRGDVTDKDVVVLAHLEDTLSDGC